MIENVLVRKNLSLKAKITVKSIISVGIVALAVFAAVSGLFSKKIAHNAWMALQAVIVPFAVMGLKALLDRDKND